MPKTSVKKGAKKSKKSGANGVEFDNSQFLEDCAGYNEQVAAAREQSGLPLPDVGTYVCQLLSISKGYHEARSGENKGKRFPFVCPRFEIVDENSDQAGRKFDVFVSFGSPWKIKFLDAMVEDQLDMRLMLQELDNRIDWLFEIEVTESKGKDGRIYKNTAVVGVGEDDGATDEDPEDPDDD